ncbi:hypothetical protein SDC9_91846 [bioreactor metagenome]|uniref:ClpX-type ZB domain-containing protein n=1 Tax=bioreactor metagenome TaxID=1076179 RepID=A0A644ZW08_9ZZZZ
MIKKTIEYYCDCCKKQVNNREDLSNIEIWLGKNGGIIGKQVCIKCLRIYTDKIGEIIKEMFGDEFKKDI